MQQRATATLSPPRIFLAFVLALAGAMLAAALLSPWVHAALSPLGSFPLHRVFSRLTMLGVIAITVWLLLRHGLANRAVLGFLGPWPRFLRRVTVGLAAGLVLMAVALVPLFLLHVREWNQQAPAQWSQWLGLAAKGIGSGLAVALIEETFFRGAMQGALQRIGARHWALFAVPVFYAAVHFLGRAARVPDDQVDAWSGFVALQGFFAGLGQPLAIVDAFVALWCVGLLLALVRQRWGDLAGCIGLHAGFVATIAAFRKVSAPAPMNDWSFIVGSFDGLLGWWIAVLTGVICAIVARAPRK
jgi:hypothetical protein